MNGVAHTSAQRFNGRGQASRLQFIPISSQFTLMQLGPCLNEPPLTPRQVAGNQLDRIERENPHVVLIVGVKVRSMMRRSWFGEHTDNDPKEPG
jgi:hypothetical protein